MIEALNLTKRYGGKTAVDGVNFTIAPGSVTGFLGPALTPGSWFMPLPGG